MVRVLFWVWGLFPPTPLLCCFVFLTNLVPFRVLQRFLLGWGGSGWSGSVSWLNGADDGAPHLVVYLLQQVSVRSPCFLSFYWVDRSVLRLQWVNDQFIIQLNYLTLAFISDRVLPTSWSWPTSENCPLWQHFLVNLAYFNHLAILAVFIALLWLLLREKSVEVQSTWSYQETGSD